MSFVMNQFTKFNKDLTKREGYLNRYIKVKTIIDSQFVLNLDDEESTLYFDDESGSLRLTSETYDKTFINGLTKKTPSTKYSQKGGTTIFFSQPKGNWILLPEGKEDFSKYYIVYNPITRKEFLNYYDNNSEKAENLINQICNDLSDLTTYKNDTYPLNPVCNCLNNNDYNYCDQNLFGNNSGLKNYVFDSLSSDNQEKISKNCICLNPTCANSNIELIKKIKSKKNCLSEIKIDDICGEKNYNFFANSASKLIDKCEEKYENESYCEYSDWGPYSSCDVKCGEGVQKRTRTIIKKRKDGKECDEKLEQTKKCRMRECKEGELGREIKIPLSFGAKSIIFFSIIVLIIIIIILLIYFVRKFRNKNKENKKIISNLSNMIEQKETKEIKEIK